MAWSVRERTAGQYNRVKVSDFGLARDLAEKEKEKGSHGYYNPEGTGTVQYSVVRAHSPVRSYRYTGTFFFCFTIQNCTEVRGVGGPGDVRRNLMADWLYCGLDTVFVTVAH
jgi:hypothetical protein